MGVQRDSQNPLKGTVYAQSVSMSVEYDPICPVKCVCSTHTSHLAFRVRFGNENKSWAFSDHKKIARLAVIPDEQAPAVRVEWHL